MNFIMNFAIAVFLMSPIWPLGPNPLPGDPLIIINKKTNELALIVDNQIQVVYPVATGKNKEDTPEGLFTVTFKIEKPFYTKLQLSGNDPNNPLGSRWIGFDALGTNGRVYGIHGTNKPDSIGTYASHGCIRMNNSDVEAIYDQIPLGTKVLIVNTHEPFIDLAKKYGAISSK